MRWMLVWLLGAGGVMAEPLDTAEAFDAYTQGKTLTFSRNDGRGVFAAETYLPRQRVRWMTRDGTCAEGSWFAERKQICFVYDNNPDPQCWLTRLEDSGLVAVLSGDAGISTIYETPPGDVVFECLGPAVGA